MKFCSLFSGSSGNCLFVSDENTGILIDAGVSGRRIEDALSKIGERCEDISGILVTHEHSDHISGVGILSRRYGIPVYANELTWRAIDGQKLMGKLPFQSRRIISADADFNVGTLLVRAYSIPHDAADPVAYTVSSGGHKISVATDIGHVTEYIKSNLFGSELVLIESNHDVEMLKVGSYPYPLKRRILGDFGHLSNEAAAALICELAARGTKKFILGHLSKENNYPGLAYETVNSDLLINGFKSGLDVFVSVAARDHVGDVVVL